MSHWPQQSPRVRSAQLQLPPTPDPHEPTEITSDGCNFKTLSFEITSKVAMVTDTVLNE